MSDIFLLVFTDTHFLSAFFQTVIIIFLGFLFMRAEIVDSAGKKTITALNPINTYYVPYEFCSLSYVLTMDVKNRFCDL